MFLCQNAIHTRLRGNIYQLCMILLPITHYYQNYELLIPLCLSLIYISYILISITLNQVSDNNQYFCGNLRHMTNDSRKSPLQHTPTALRQYDTMQEWLDTTSTIGNITVTQK